MYIHPVLKTAPFSGGAIRGLSPTVQCLPNYEAKTVFIQAGAFDTGKLLEAGQAPTNYHDQPGTET